MNLFCLPYSGASASIYYQWQRELPHWLTVCPVELPGRGMRMDEPLQTNMAVLVEQLAEEVSQRIGNQPYAVFGHSLGAILAFELVRRLINIGATTPVTLFVSGTSAPTRRQRCVEQLSELTTTADVKSYLRKLGGMSEDVIDNEELMAMALPVICSDFELCKSYSYAPGLKRNLPCPLVVISGQDEDITSDELLAWQDEAGECFYLSTFRGGHFFIHDSRDDVIRFVRNHLRPFWQKNNSKEIFTRGYTSLV